MPDTLSREEIDAIRHGHRGDTECEQARLLAHIDALTEACLKCGQPVVGWFRHGQETGHWPNGDPVVAFAGEPSEKPAYQVGSAWPGEPHDA